MRPRRSLIGKMTRSRKRSNGTGMSSPVITSPASTISSGDTPLPARCCFSALARIGGKADAEGALRGVRDLALVEIGAGGGAALAGELGLEEAGGELHDVDEARARASRALRCPGRGAGSGTPASAGEALDGLGEGDALDLDQEGEDVAVLAAAEAVVAAAAVIGVEGGRLLAMERAAGPVVALRRLRLPPVPLHAPADHRGQRHAGADLVEKGLGIAQRAIRSIRLRGESVHRAGVRSESRRGLGPRIHRR